MVRLQGPVVIHLAEALIGDWVLETNDLVKTLVDESGITQVDPQGNTDIQVIASGPGQTSDALLQMLLALINAAREKIVITTPYLVPDDALILALRGVAARGVKILLIVPEKIDSFFTRHASESYYEELIEAGMEIYLFNGGFLHTKSISVDEALSMFGTVNLDMRSLWVNYEVSLFVYDKSFTQHLKLLQQQYIDQSTLLDPEKWKKRSYVRQIMQNGLRLAGPLL